MIFILSNPKVSVLRVIQHNDSLIFSLFWYQDWYMVGARDHIEYHIQLDQIHLNFIKYSSFKHYTRKIYRGG